MTMAKNGSGRTPRDLFLTVMEQRLRHVHDAMMNLAVDMCCLNHLMNEGDVMVIAADLKASVYAVVNTIATVKGLDGEAMMNPKKKEGK